MNIHSRLPAVRDRRPSTDFERLRNLERAISNLVLRSPVGPAVTTSSSWAGTLAHDLVGQFITSLAPMSAAAKLFSAAPRMSLSGIHSIRFPSRASSINPNAIQWIAEGMPAPVLQFSLLSGPVLGPVKKMMGFAVVTRELADSSDAETVISTLLRENCALSLDTSLFSNTAATPARPPGILNGVAPLTAATGGGDTALTTDLSALAGAISSVTAGLAYIANPAQAHAIKIRRGLLFASDIPVWATIGVAPGTVIALDPAAFVSAFGGDPEVTSSTESSLHFEDTSPTEIVSSPGTVASPAKSLFQTELIASRLRLEAAWAWRTLGAVAWVTNTTW